MPSQIQTKKNNLTPEALPPRPLPCHLIKNRHIYTVSEITRDIKLVLENTFGEIWVEGELSGARKIPTGTIFFNLKDNTSVLRCVIFAANLQNLKFELKDGIKIISFGKISVYEKRGDYQLYVQLIEPKGIGGLQLALEQLKKKLEKEGLFRAGHKKPIPYLPSTIGIVTSLQGAALKDMLRVLDRRFSDVYIIISPAQVQGEEAKYEISQAIEEMNCLNEKLPLRERIDVMIVGRGGGSIEDLWAFNEEVVARAIYNSKIPVISAVGHERDWTIADLVADLRSATPSAAAEIVVPKKEDLKEKLKFFTAGFKHAISDAINRLQENLDDTTHRLVLDMGHVLELSANEFDLLRKKLALLSPAALVQLNKTRATDLARQIYVQIQHFIKIKEARFNTLLEKLSSLSPLNILGRGYSITFKMPENIIIKDAKLIKPGDSIRTKLHQAEIISKITQLS